MQYSPERKAAVLKKMMPPHNRSIPEFPREEGSSEETLFNWRKKPDPGDSDTKDGDTGPSGWSAARGKFAAGLWKARL